MLYITTRNKTDSYTAYRALHEGFAPDGGHFLPIRLPLFSKDQIEEMKENSFCETVARVLNIFFSARLSGWDIEFAIGRKPSGFAGIGRKIMIAELWKNTENSYKACAERIYALLCGSESSKKKVFGWPSVAIRIAYIFGVFCSLFREDIATADAAVAGGDFETAISLWYAKKMGLPIGRIICGSNENCGIWDLIHKGQIDMGATVVSTDTSDMDAAVSTGVERLIYGTLGLSENLRYLSAVERKTTYQIKQDELPLLNDGLFCSVVGKDRGRDIMKSVQSTHDYLIDPYTAIAYGALQDYRAKFGENRITILFAEENPVHYYDLADNRIVR